jgi:hypothetical protein
MYVNESSLQSNLSLKAKVISKKLKWMLIQYINKLYPKLKANRDYPHLFATEPL